LQMAPVRAHRDTRSFAPKEMLAAFGRMSAARLSARTGLKVKCLFAIDAIAAVYRADSARFENGPTREPVGIGISDPPS
jgi:hypothetical protein